MIIGKVFNGIFDEDVHSAFLKFGRGEYRNRYLLEGKRQIKKWLIKAGPEYSNFLVRRCLEKFDRLVVIKGIIVSTLDLRDEIGFEIVKAGNFQGVRKFQIDAEVEPSQIIELMDKYPKAFFALSFNGSPLDSSGHQTGLGFDLKVKAKAPVSGKPGKEKGDVVDFCSLKTSDKNIVDELFFGVGDFERVSVDYTIRVDEIIYPSNIDELKPSEVRELAKRKGVVVRNVNVDGIKREMRAEFLV